MRFSECTENRISYLRRIKNGWRPFSATGVQTAINRAGKLMPQPVYQWLVGNGLIEPDGDAICLRAKGEQLITCIDLIRDLKNKFGRTWRMVLQDQWDETSDTNVRFARNTFGPTGIRT